MKSRYKKYVTENPHPIKLIGQCKGGYDVEKKIHKQLHEYHYRGEWFIFNDEVREKIYLIIKENRDNIEPIYKKKTRKTKTKKEDEIIQHLQEYKTQSGYVDVTPSVKSQISGELGITETVFQRHLSKLLASNKLTRIDTSLYLM